MPYTHVPEGWVGKIVHVQDQDKETYHNQPHVHRLILLFAHSMNLSFD